MHLFLVAFLVLVASDRSVRSDAQNAPFVAFASDCSPSRLAQEDVLQGEEDRREDVLQCRALGERALRRG